MCISMYKRYIYIYILCLYIYICIYVYILCCCYSLMVLLKPLLRIHVLWVDQEILAATRMD